MQEWIAEATRHGYAVSHGERDAGLSAVAVPIVGRSGSVVAALTLSGPTVRFTDDRVAEFAEALLAAADRMNERGFDHPLGSSF
jgi:DNA-binding IclR family transcriptional regulator